MLRTKTFSTSAWSCP